MVKDKGWNKKDKERRLFSLNFIQINHNLTFMRPVEINPPLNPSYESIECCTPACNKTYKSAIKVSFYVFGGLLCDMFNSSFAVPFYAMGTSIFCVQVLSKHGPNCHTYQVINKRLVNMNDEYTCLQPIVFIFSLAISTLSTNAGAVVAGLLGILSGIVLKVDVDTTDQEFRRVQFENQLKLAAVVFSSA
jgi:hypothetical protein